MSQARLLTCSYSEEFRCLERSLMTQSQAGVTSSRGTWYNVFPDKKGHSSPAGKLGTGEPGYNYSRGNAGLFLREKILNLQTSRKFLRRSRTYHVTNLMAKSEAPRRAPTWGELRRSWERPRSRCSRALQPLRTPMATFTRVGSRRRPDSGTDLLG